MVCFWGSSHTEPQQVGPGCLGEPTFPSTHPRGTSPKTKPWGPAPGLPPKGSWPVHWRIFGVRISMAGAGVTFLEELAYMAETSPELTAFAPWSCESLPRGVGLGRLQLWISGAFAVSFYLCKLCYKHIINMRNIWQLDIIQRDLDHGCIDLYTFVCCYIMELKSPGIKLMPVNLQPGEYLLKPRWPPFQEHEWNFHLPTLCEDYLSC